MTSLLVELPEQSLETLAQMAAERGVSVEDLARESIERLIAERRERFRRAADHVLEKNDELYRRLA